MLYETIFCPECKYRNSLCEMKKLSEVEFDLSLFDYFPNEPFDIKTIDQYDRIKLEAIPLNIRIPKFVPTMDSKSALIKELFYPLSSFSTNTKNPRNIHNTFKNSRVGLLMTGKDGMLIDFIKSSTWVEKIVAKNFDYVFAPNLSFYTNQPSCSTVYNRLLSYLTIYQLNNASVPVIPSVNYLWELDLKRYSAWLNESGFRYVYVNAQMITGEKQFQSFLQCVKKIHKSIKAKLIIIGVLDIKRIVELNKISKTFIYSNSAIHALSSLRLLWNPTGNYKRVNPVEGGMYYDDVFKRNFRNYTKKLYKVINYEGYKSRSKG